MPTEGKTAWRIIGEEIGSCNCAWGCPCQFMALPTHGRCEAMAAFLVHEGHFGKISLEGVRWVELLSWPGAVHEGNGTRGIVIDESATPQQRQALVELWNGKHGGKYFEIFSAVCPTALEPIFAPISVKVDRERRVASVRVPGIGESTIEPIRNPVTGEEHRARIDLPNGFEYKIAEMANALQLKVSTGPLQMEHRNTYAQLSAIDWSNA